MFWNRSNARILQQWQAEIDHSLETGQTPLLQMGESQTFLDTVPGSAALQEMLDRRVLANTPLLLFGGSSPAWLVALWQRRTTPELARSGNVRVVYSGMDVATNIATIAVSSSAESERLHHWREVRPLSLAAQIEPESYASVPPSLTELPLSVMDGDWTVAENMLQDWVAWLAVSLILIVFVVSVLRTALS